MPYITHPTGQKTFYRDDCFADPWKPTETILIQHGFGRSSAFGYAWVPILAKNYRVIRRDALGHGHSSAPPADHPISFDSVIDEMIETLDQLKIAKVHLLCESTGGIFGDSARNAARGVEAARVRFSDGTGVGARAGRSGLGEKFIETSRTDQGAPDGYMDWWLEQFSIPGAEGLAAYATIVCSEDADAHPRMHQIKVPMLLLTPANNVLIDIEDQKRLAGAANGRLEIIPGHGHEIYLDQAKLCQDKFLDSIGKATR